MLLFLPGDAAVTLFISSMASPVLQSFCCANSSFLLYGNLPESVLLSVDDQAFLWYNVLCVVTSTSGVGGCLYQLVKRTPRCVGCLTTPDNALLLLVQNNIIGCIATADLLAVLGTSAKLIDVTECTVL